MTAPDRDNESAPTTAMIGEYKEEYLLQRAREIVEKRTKGWEIGNESALDRIPRFERDRKLNCCHFYETAFEYSWWA